MSAKAHAIPYRPGHLDCLETKDMFNRDANEIALDGFSRSEIAHIRTIFVGRTPVAIVGLCLLRPGMAEVWSLTSELIAKHPVSFHKAVLELLDDFQKKLSLFRIQMTVRSDYKQGQRWAEGLGFCFEGVLQHYSPDGSNHCMYGRIHHG